MQTEPDAFSILKLRAITELTLSTKAPWLFFHCPDFFFYFQEMLFHLFAMSFAVVVVDHIRPSFSSVDT